MPASFRSGGEYSSFGRGWKGAMTFGSICSVPALPDRQHTEFILPAARLKGSFLPGSMFLPGLLAIAHEVIKQSFRDASIDGGEVT